MDTKNNYLKSCRSRFGMYATNEFVKRCMSFALQDKNFFFDVLSVDESLRSKYLVGGSCVEEGSQSSSCEDSYVV